MKYIGCFLMTEKGLEKAGIPEKMLIELSRSLREKGKETVHFAEKSMKIEGIYIPGKGSKNGIIVVPNMGE